MNDRSTKVCQLVLVEDDEKLAAAVREYLSRNQIEVTSVLDGRLALAEVARIKPDIVVLDIMLPGIDGFEVCKQLRAAGHQMPVVMLTARDEDFDRVIGLELGADDYLIKPIQPRVLLAHIKAMLRRQGTVGVADNTPELLTFGHLQISRATRDVILDRERIRMTSAEFDLLWLLAAHAGTVMHREDILQRLRGLEYAHEDRSVDARLYRLRKRFGTSPDIHNRIKTVRPHGYMFSMEPW
jgi:two-component system, OmpR family, response regulator